METLPTKPHRAKKKNPSFGPNIFTLGPAVRSLGWEPAKPSGFGRTEWGNAAWDLMALFFSFSSASRKKNKSWRLAIAAATGEEAPNSDRCSGLKEQEDRHGGEPILNSTLRLFFFTSIWRIVVGASAVAAGDGIRSGREPGAVGGGRRRRRDAEDAVSLSIYVSVLACSVQIAICVN